MSECDEKTPKPAPWRTQTEEAIQARIDALYHPGPLPQHRQPRKAITDYDELDTRY